MRIVSKQGAGSNFGARARHRYSKYSITIRENSGKIDIIVTANSDLGGDVLDIPPQIARAISHGIGLVLATEDEVSFDVSEKV